MNAVFSWPWDVMFMFLFMARHLFNQKEWHSTLEVRTLYHLTIKLFYGFNMFEVFFHARTWFGSRINKLFQNHQNVNDTQHHHFLKIFDLFRSCASKLLTLQKRCFFWWDSDWDRLYAALIGHTCSWAWRLILEGDLLINCVDWSFCVDAASIVPLSFTW